MGVINRLNRVTSARLHAFLSASERPEDILPGLLREMEEQDRAAARAVAKALAAVRAAQSRLDESEGKIGRLEEGAALALAQGDEQLAREALAAAVRTGREKDRFLSALDQAQRALEQARAAKLRIEDQLEELRVNRDGILARSWALRARQGAAHGSAFSEKKSGSILERVAAIETDLERDEAELEIPRAATPGTRVSLEERLRDTERRAEIDRRLNDLKKRRHGANQPRGDRDP
jgi:phage shock protein A